MRNVLDVLRKLLRELRTCGTGASDHWLTARLVKPHNHLNPVIQQGSERTKFSWEMMRVCHETEIILDRWIKGSHKLADPLGELDKLQHDMDLMRCDLLLTDAATFLMLEDALQLVREIIQAEARFEQRANTVMSAWSIMCNEGKPSDLDPIPA